MKLDKYNLYEKAVQSPDVDVDFIQRTYTKLRGRKALTMREDFCAAFALSCEWVKKHSSYKAFGVDLDPEPLLYGRKNYLPRLTADQQKRLTILNKNVLDKGLPRADVICALNFSYFVLKSRALLKAYFKNCLAHLPKNGVLLLDCFGGPACHEPSVERKRKKGFYYYWDQKSWDPITHEAKFAIHFQPYGGHKINNVFTYDWRMWSIPEIRELLNESGFKKSVVYWEGTSANGDGNGVYRPLEHVREEGVKAWICYVAALK